MSSKSGAEGTPSVAIIGAGLGGIATAVKLTQAGIRTFTIFEKSEGPGGTWWDNTYPGVECDVPSHLYSFSFKLHDWSRTHAGQEEIQRYVEEIIDAFDLRPHLRLRTEVERAVWDDDRHLYRLRTAAGEEIEANVVVSALGLLNVPQYPDWPGLDEFAGPTFHTARWEHEHDLTGKRVAVVGAGSSATQVVPAIAPVVKQVYMFQREAPWVLPKGERDYTPQEIAAFAGRWPSVAERLQILYTLDRGTLGVADPDSRIGIKAREACLAHIESVFGDRPELREVMTPDYPFRCKRIIVSSTFYPALVRDNVELVPRAVTRVTPTGVVDADGVEREVDVLVLATGFQPWNFLASLEVVGRAGRSLHGVWGDEPEAFLGLTVAGFPNFFILYGPNTNGGCVSFTLERQAEYAARAIATMVRRNVSAIEVRRSAMALYNRVLSRRLTRVRTWEANCHSYYHGPTGKNVTQWPWTHAAYWLATKTLGRLSMVGRRRPAPPATTA